MIDQESKDALLQETRQIVEAHVNALNEAAPQKRLNRAAIIGAESLKTIQKLEALLGTNMLSNPDIDSQEMGMSELGMVYGALDTYHNQLITYQLSNDGVPPLERQQKIAASAAMNMIQNALGVKAPDFMEHEPASIIGR